MLSSTPEQTGRFDPEIPDLFLASVDSCKQVRLLYLLPLGFRLLLLRRGQLLLLFLLKLKVLEHWPEIALVEILDLDPLSGRVIFEEFQPVAEKVGLESLVGGVFSFEQGGKETSHLFRLWIERQWCT